MRLKDMKPILIDGGSAGKVWLKPHAATRDISTNRFICECGECGHKTPKMFTKGWCTNCGARFKEGYEE